MMRLRGLRVRLALGALLASGTLLCTTDLQAQDQAGVTAAVRGRVELASRPGEVGRLVRSGEPVFLGNAIKSGPEAGLQLLLLDQTTFTIGPDSEITIDEFVYDPQRGGGGKVTASVAKGVFRFVTGRVAQNNPADMVVKLPVGTIGIRGTIAMGSVDRPNPNNTDGIRQQVVLVGPGSNVDSKDRVGAIFVTGNGGSGATINQPGFGSQLGFGGPGWGDAIRFTPEMIAGIQNRLNPPPPPAGQGGQQQGTGGQATANAGAGATESKSEVQQLTLVSGIVNLANAINSDASNQQVRDTGIDQGQSDGQQMQTIIDGVAKFGDLQKIISGTASYSQTNVPLFTTSGSQSGSYSIGVNVNFATRQVATAGSFLDIRSPLVSGNGIPNPVSYANASPDAFALFFFGKNSGTGDFVGSGCGTSQQCNVNLLTAPLNASGKVGASLFHALSVLNDRDTSVLFGTGVAGQQSATVTNPGAIPTGQSTFDQLRNISSGQFYYSQNGVSLGSGNAYSISANIDFGARTFGGGNSKVVISGSTLSGTIALASQSYASLAGNANFQYTSGLFLGGGCSPTCTTTINAAPQNANNTAGLTLNHSVSVSNGFAIVASGSGTAPRAGGLTP